MICGQAIDYLRSAYISTVKMWNDRDDLVLGRWIRLPDDAPLFKGPHPWGSLHTWDRDFEPAEEDVGEKAYVSWSNGAVPVGYGGDHVCGSDEAARNGGVDGRDPVLELDEDGKSDCCYTPVICGFPDRAAWAFSWEGLGNCTCMGLIETTLFKDEEESIPGSVTSWRAGPLGTFPLVWGGT